MEVGDRDLLNPNTMRDDMHDWVVANEQMAKVLAAKHYPYQFVFARNAGHVERSVRQQTTAGSAGVRVAGIQGKVEFDQFWTLRRKQVGVWSLTIPAACMNA